MKTWWKEVKRSCLHLCFPARCLHCRISLPPDEAVFCPACAALLDLIDPQERCLTCFNVKDSSHPHGCLFCARFPSLFLRMGAIFDYQGPAATLIRQLKYAHQPGLAKGMGAFLLTQFDRLGWPVPDALIPVPLSFSRWLDRGYNQSALLAEELGRLLQVPVCQALKRTSSGYAQASLTLEQRLCLENVFKWKKSYKIQDKTLLVIDDVMTSGATLQRCAEALSEGCPAALYALTVCR